MNDSANPRTEAANTGLAAQLLSPDRLEPFIADCQTLVTDEMKHKGITVRTAFGVVQKIKPDIVDRSVRELMPAFVREIEPFYADWRANNGDDFQAYLIAHDGAVADAMLTVTDRRGERIHNRAIRSGYSRVRGRAKRELVDTMPRIAATIVRHLHDDVA